MSANKGKNRTRKLGKVGGGWDQVCFAYWTLEHTNV